jgi:hypothetical protein
MTPLTSYSQSTKIQAAIDRIEMAARAHEWFHAVVYTAAILERQCILRINEFLQTSGKNCQRAPWHLNQSALLLFALDLIEQRDYDLLLKLNKARNEFVHRGEHPKYKRGKEADEKYSILIEEALRIMTNPLRISDVPVSR